MKKTRSKKKSVSFADDVVLLKDLMKPRKSRNKKVRIPKKSGGAEVAEGQASGSKKKGDKPRKIYSKRSKVLLKSAKKEAENPKEDKNPKEDENPKEDKNPKEDENAKKRKTWLLTDSEESDEAGTREEQKAFRREVETFYKENSLEFKKPKFYGKPFNMLKLWRKVIKFGGYEGVTTRNLWRQIGESFNPPKTCTTVSYTFRQFYEKTLLEYEKYLEKNGDLDLPGSQVMLVPKADKEVIDPQGSGSSRVQRDSALRARVGWHALDLDGPDEDYEDLTPKVKKLKSSEQQKNKSPINEEDLPASPEAFKQSVAEIYDDGPIADWVKISVYETKDLFEIFALVPGLIAHEVKVQAACDGRIVIIGQPDDHDDIWGTTPFKKIVALSARIDASGVSSVLSYNGRLFIQAPRFSSN